VRNLPVEVDPPIQRIYKRLITPFFTPKVVAAYEQRTRELRIGLEEALRRLQDIRLADGAEIHYHSTTTRSPLTLPITFTPGPREGAAGAA
jgi:cytochrome P450